MVAAALLLLVYLVLPVVALLSMLLNRTFSLPRFRALWRPPRGVTREDWVAVYGYLGTNLESSNAPQEKQPRRSRRVLAVEASFLISVVLLLVPLPLHLPLSFAQYRWDALPLVQAAAGGAALALAVGLAFHRRRRYLLDDPARADYPYLPWGRLRAPGASEAKS